MTCAHQTNGGLDRIVSTGNALSAEQDVLLDELLARINLRLDTRTACLVHSTPTLGDLPTNRAVDIPTICLDPLSQKRLEWHAYLWLLVERRPLGWYATAASRHCGPNKIRWGATSQAQGAASQAQDWRCWFFENALTHFAEDAELSELTVRDLIGRGCAPAEDLPARPNGRAYAEIAMDMGGMCYVNEPHEVLDLCGTRLHVPSIQVPDLISEVRRLPPRTFQIAGGSVEYRKLKIWHHAFVMRPSTAEVLLQVLEQARDSAAARYAIFEQQRAELKGVS